MWICTSHPTAAPIMVRCRAQHEMQAENCRRLEEPDEEHERGRQDVRRVDDVRRELERPRDGEDPPPHQPPRRRREPRAQVPRERDQRISLFVQTTSGPKYGHSPVAKSETEEKDLRLILEKETAREAEQKAKREHGGQRRPPPPSMSARSHGVAVTRAHHDLEISGFYSLQRSLNPPP